MNLIRLIAYCFAISIAHAKPLPRVLILGDEVYRQPRDIIAKELSGKIELVRPEIKTREMLSSATIITFLDDLLGKEKWDLILFNVGIVDLIHRAPNMKSFRLMPIEQGGVRNTSDKDYEANLIKLTGRLKATGAKLAWLSTTPTKDALIFVPDSEIGTNAIAAKVMAAQKIPVIDMHGHITSLTAKLPPRAAQWETFGSKKIAIHEPIVDFIKRQKILP
jgi:hypothetical protein